MSTSMLVTRMREAAAVDGKDYSINSYGLHDLMKVAAHADVVLIGPQIRYALAAVKEKVGPNIPVGVIDMDSYARIDAKGSLKLAEDLLAEKAEEESLQY